MKSESKSIRQRLSERPSFVERDIPGFGKARFKLISAGDMQTLADVPDEQFAFAVLAASLIEEDGAGVFTADEAAAMPFADIKPLREAALEINNLKKDAAAGKSDSPPPSP